MLSKIELEKVLVGKGNLTQGGITGDAFLDSQGNLVIPAKGYGAKKAIVAALKTLGIEASISRMNQAPFAQVNSNQFPSLKANFPNFGSDSKNDQTNEQEEKQQTTPTAEELAIILSTHKGRRGQQMQWLTFSTQEEANQALKSVLSLYPSLPNISSAKVTAGKHNDWFFGLSHGQWSKVVSPFVKSEDSDKQASSVREAQLQFVDYFINNRSKDTHPEGYQKRMALIKLYASQQQVYFRPEFMPVYENGHHLDHLKLGYKPLESKVYDKKTIDLAPEFQDSHYRHLSKYRMVYGPIPYYLNGFESKPTVIDTISACAINLMGSSKTDEKAYMLANGSLNEMAYREECLSNADFLLGVAKSRGANKFVMPPFGVGAYIALIQDVNEKQKAKKIMNEAFAAMAKKHQITVDWVVWIKDKNANAEKNTLDSQTTGNIYMNHVIADLMDYTKSQNDAGFKCAMLNPGSDRTIGGKYYVNDPHTLEEQMAQKSELLFLHSVYNEEMIAKFESDLKLAKGLKAESSPESQIDEENHTNAVGSETTKKSGVVEVDSKTNTNKSVSELLQSIDFENQLKQLVLLKDSIHSKNPDAANALNSFILKVTTAKDTWEKNPTDWQGFVNNCNNGLKEASNSALQDFSEWNVLARIFAKAINWLASWFTQTPVYQTTEYAQLSMFAKQLKSLETHDDFSNTTGFQPKQ